METYLVRDKANHTLAVLTTAIDPVYQSSSEYDSDAREVYMVVIGDQSPEKTAKEIQREAEEEMARAECLHRELDKRKGHNGL
jgi:hypothetical protein